MIYCTNCGSRLETVEKFCSNCGAPMDLPEKIEAPSPMRQELQYDTPKNTNNRHTSHPSQPPKTRINPKMNKSAKKSLRSVIVLVLILGGVYGFGLLMAPTTSIQETEIFTAGPEELDQIKHIYINVPSMDVNIQYNTTPQADVCFLEATFDFNVRGYGIDSLEDVYETVFHAESDVIEFVVISENILMKLITHDESKLDITLRTDVVYDLNIDISSGDLNVVIPKETEIEGFLVDLSSGNAYVEFQEGSIVNDYLEVDLSSGDIEIAAHATTFIGDVAFDTSSGNIYATFINSQLPSYLGIDISSGDIDLYLENVSYSSDSYWDVEISSGNIDVVIYQYINPEVEVTGEFSVSSGDINIGYYSLENISQARFNTDISSGEVSLSSLIGFSSYDGEIVSDDFVEGNNGYDFYVDISSGDIFIECSLE